MFRVILSILALLATTQALAGPDLSEADARSILEDAWNALTFPVPLGTFVVINGNADPSKGIITPSTYGSLVNWQKAGIISIVEDKQYEDFRSGKGFSVNQWMQLTTQGIQKKITVAATERGRTFLAPNPPERLQIPQGRFTVTKLLKNEERRKGVDDLRILMLTYEADWSKEMKTYFSAAGTQFAEKRKAMVLLKYDPFESKWKRIATDLANANEEFASNNVAQTLAK